MHRVSLFRFEQTLLGTLHGMGAEWLTDDEQIWWREVLRFSATLLDELEVALAEHEAHPADYEVLVWLSEADGHRLRMTDLANRVLISKSRLTYRIDGLVAAKLVRRERCDSDRRGLFAVLTPAGLRRLEELAPPHVQSVREALVDRLTPAEFAQLGTLAAKVNAANRKEVPRS